MNKALLPLALIVLLVVISGCIQLPSGDGNGNGTPTPTPTMTPSPTPAGECRQGSCSDIGGMWYAGGRCMVTKCTCIGCEKFWDCWNEWGTGECQEFQNCQERYGTEYIPASYEYVYKEDITKTTRELCEG